MRTFAIAVVLSLGLCGDAWSQSSEAWISGTVRCATWLSNQTYEEQGKLWILGYWSGMNVFHEDRTVGNQMYTRKIYLQGGWLQQPYSRRFQCSGRRA
jgi:hypothetical protein